MNESFSGADFKPHRATCPGRLIWLGDIDDVRRALRDATKTAHRPFSGAGSTYPLAGAGKRSEAVFDALPIASINWTDDAKNATCARYTETGGQSNEF